MGITVSGTTITFNDGTTQSTAAGVPSSLSAIGSIVIAAVAVTTGTIQGSTVAGSLVYIPTTLISFNANNQFFTTGTGSLWYGIEGGRYIALGRGIRDGTGNPGFTMPNGFTAQSGTWRLLAPVLARIYSYDSSYNTNSSSAWATLVQRIA